MRLSSLTAIGFCANIAIDQRKSAQFSFDDIYDASERGTLVDLLKQSIDDSGLIELVSQNPADKAELENALSDGIEALRGRELRKVGVGDNPLCMVMAIILETIQQNFSR